MTLEIATSEKSAALHAAAAPRIVNDDELDRVLAPSTDAWVINRCGRLSCGSGEASAISLWLATSLPSKSTTT